MHIPNTIEYIISFWISCAYLVWHIGRTVYWRLSLGNSDRKHQPLIAGEIVDKLDLPAETKLLSIFMIPR